MPSGVRNVLDNAVDRAVGSKHAEFVYLTSEIIAGAVCESVLWLRRHWPL